MRSFRYFEPSQGTAQALTERALRALANGDEVELRFLEEEIAKREAAEEAERRARAAARARTRRKVVLTVALLGALALLVSALGGELRWPR